MFRKGYLRRHLRPPPHAALFPYQLFVPQKGLLSLEQNLLHQNELTCTLHLPPYPVAHTMRLGSVFVFTCALSSGATSQTHPPSLAEILSAMEGTASTAHRAQFERGELSARLIEFNALIRDRSTGSTHYSKIGGSFGFMQANRTVAPILKIIVHNLNKLSGNLVPAAPTAAYIADGAKTNAADVVTSFNSEPLGSLFVVFQPVATSDIVTCSITNQKITLLFNRTGRGLDIPVGLDLRVTDTKATGERQFSNQTSDDMLACIRALVSAAGN
jgi:hypothetical protein